MKKKRNAKTVASNVKKPGGNTGKGFKPGQSGNPSGRPKGMALLGEMIRDHAKEMVTTGKGKYKQAKMRLRLLIEKLYKSDPRTYLAYGYGKPVEMAELAGAEGAPVQFKIALSESELP